MNELLLCLYGEESKSTWFIRLHDSDHSLASSHPSTKKLSVRGGRGDHRSRSVFSSSVWLMCHSCFLASSYAFILANEMVFLWRAEESRTSYSSSSSQSSSMMICWCCHGFLSRPHCLSWILLQSDVLNFVMLACSVVSSMSTSTRPLPFASNFRMWIPSFFFMHQLSEVELLSIVDSGS